MLNIDRKLTPVQRKPRSLKTITKKQRKPQLPRMKTANVVKVPSANPPVQAKGWSNSDIEQSYTK